MVPSVVASRARSDRETKANEFNYLDGSGAALVEIADPHFCGILSSFYDRKDSASLVFKTIGGRRYWYAQRREGEKKVQGYIGPESPEVGALVERWRPRPGWHCRLATVDSLRPDWL